MEDDPFGDLAEWGNVLTQLEFLSSQGRLDQAQPGLVRLLRFRGNWQILEQTLIHARKVVRPTPQLLTAVAEIVTDRDVYLDARILAVNALGDILSRTPPVISLRQRQRIVGGFRRLLRVPEAPVFQLALERAIEKIERSRSTAASVPSLPTNTLHR